MNTLEGSALQMISNLVFDAWSLPKEQISSDKIIHLKTDCYHYMDLPPQITLAIAEEMALRHGSLSFGLAIWMLEANNQTLKSMWFKHLNLKELCAFLSEETKQNLLELSVDSLFPVRFIESAICFTHLKILEILYDFKLNNWQVELIISNCTSLEQIHLTGCRNVDGHAFDRLWLLESVKLNLRSLDVSHTSVSASRAVSLLEQLTELKEFYFHDISGFLRYQHRDANFARNVQKLQLGDVEYGRWFSLTPENEFAPATRNFKVLKEIILAIPPTCPVEVLHRICKNCNNLKVLRLSFEQALLDDGVEGDPELYNFQNVYESIYPHRNDLTYQLTELELAWVQAIDLHLIFCTFPLLNKLAFIHCTVMKNERSLQKPLAKLFLSQMSSKVVNQILRNCIHLQELRIFEVDLAVNAFHGVQLDDLKKISVECCTGYSLNNVAQLKALTQLT